MNKKILIISLCIILLVIVGSSIVFADFHISETKENLALKNSISIEESYVQVNTRSINAKENIQLAEYYLTTFNLTDKKFNANETTIAVFNNNLESLTETVISNSDMIVKLNSETGDLISYINNKTTFEKNTLSKAIVRERALEIFKNIENEGKYELILLEQFDDEIYQAKFCKKYGEYVNPGELISFSFAPQTLEVVTFARKSVPFANNEIKISESQARTIAEEYFDKSSKYSMSISLEIVQPNAGAAEPLENNFVYQKATQTRLAYVCKFNNSSATKLYIDSTTGQVIGMDIILGGAF